ncbi:MAG: HAMP domain-containing histidine kinase [Chloroflexi bacterium]|nr:HAMP domain-containing histidine kinase [Chloroflexota bacterium]
MLPWARGSTANNPVREELDPSAGWFTPVRQYSLVSIIVVLAALWAVNTVSSRVERGVVESRLEQESEQPARVGSYRVIEALSALSLPTEDANLTFPNDRTIIDRLVMDSFAGQSVIRVDIAGPDGKFEYSSDPTISDSSPGLTQDLSQSTSNYMGTETLFSLAGDVTPREIIVTKVPIPREGTSLTDAGPAHIVVVFRDVTSAIDAATASGARFRIITVIAVMGILFASLLLVVWRGYAVAAAARRQLAMLLVHEKELSAALDDRNEKLNAAVDAKIKLLSVVTHELNNPLTSISAYSDILSRNRSGNLGEKELKATGAISRNTRRMSGLVSDLMDYSRAESNSLELDLGEHDISVLIDEVAESMIPVLQTRAQELDLAFDCDQTCIPMDRGRCEQVLINLLSNASKYSPENTAITLGCRIDRDNITIDISDQGIGMSTEDQQKLFTPFFRVDNEDTRGIDGTGLGLMISRQIAERHGGSLTIKSERGRGTTASLILPLHQSGHPA